MFWTGLGSFSGNSGGSTSGVLANAVTGGLSGMLGYGKKTDPNAAIYGSSLYGFSETAANALAEKRPDIVNAWRTYGTKYTWPQFLQIHLSTGAGPTSGYTEDANQTLSWLREFDKYGMDPEVGKEQEAYEKGFSDYVLNNYIYPDIQSDEQRSQEAQTILANYRPQLDAARATIASMFPGANGEQSAMLAEQLGYNTEVTNDQLAALQAQQQADTASLGTLLTSLKANLDVETAAKADSLMAQLSELNAGITTLTAAQRQALAQQIADNYQSLETELASKGQSLQAELQALSTATDAQSAARKQALEVELQKLYAAQEPLNAIREKGAQTLATAVNLGVQTAMDKTVADMAQQGYVGGSSGTDAALMRASVGGRQQAAQALADARLQNATDVANIGQYGAQEGYTLDTDAAAARYKDSVYGANQTRSLADYGAGQTRTIANNNAAETRTISNADADARAKLTQFGASEKRTLADYGASQNRSLSDYGATQTKALSDYGSSETRKISDSSAQRKLGYFDQDIARRLSSLSLPSQAVQAEFQLKNMADEYGQSGLKRAMSNLEWFNTGQSAAPGTTAYTGYQGTDSGFENLGAGLASLATSIGNANKWWSSPTATSSNFGSAGSSVGSSFGSGAGSAAATTSKDINTPTI